MIMNHGTQYATSLVHTRVPDHNTAPTNQQKYTAYTAKAKSININMRSAACQTRITRNTIFYG